MALINQQMNNVAARNQRNAKITQNENEAANGAMKNGQAKNRQPLKAIDANLVTKSSRPTHEDQKKQKAFEIFVDPRVAEEEKRASDVTSATAYQSKLSSPLVISTSISSNVTESHSNGWNNEDDGSVAMDVSFESLETPADEEIVEEQLYAEDIYQYCLTTEKVYKPKPSYMSKQPDINHAMRSILVDWMVEVSEEMNLSDETLFIAVSLVDRFLSKMMVLRGKLQLVGSTALFLAAKYEEIYPPAVKDFIYLTDDSYTVDQLLRMERLLLHVLGHRVAPPTPGYFLDHMTTRLKCNEIDVHLAHYLVELAMVRENYISYLPSTLSAGAICVARHLMGRQQWTNECARVTGYSQADLTNCARDLCDLLKAVKQSEQRAVKEKYGKSQYCDIASRMLKLPISYPF